MQGPSLKQRQQSLKRDCGNVQEQGMGGTVYDRDTIMKKYMGGYDGKPYAIKHMLPHAVTVKRPRVCKVKSHA